MLFRAFIKYKDALRGQQNLTCFYKEIKMTNNFLSIVDNFFNKDNFIGFQDIFTDLYQFDTMLNDKNNNPNFPPFNIYTKEIEVDGNKEVHTFVEISCAGYKKDELTLIYDEDAHILKVKGKKQNENKSDIKYVCKGIATRTFERMWKLTDKLHFLKAKYEDGILTVELKSVTASPSGEKTLEIE